jgi:hypothetical protein
MGLFRLDFWVIAYEIDQKECYAFSTEVIRRSLDTHPAPPLSYKDMGSFSIFQERLRTKLLTISINYVDASCRNALHLLLPVLVELICKSRRCKPPD